MNIPRRVASAHREELELSEEDLARLDEIWPGHRPAPEDYAW
jgi:hypothetical protein